jgi:hypothetical protein
LFGHPHRILRPLLDRAGLETIWDQASIEIVS